MMNQPIQQLAEIYREQMQQAETEMEALWGLDPEDADYGEYLKARDLYRQARTAWKTANEALVVLEGVQS